MGQKSFIIPETVLRDQAKKSDIRYLTVGAGILRNMQVLLVRRAPEDFLGGLLELPGGGVEIGETLEDTLHREVKEEVGLGITRVIKMMGGFDYEDNKQKRVHQYNFLVEVEDGDVMLDPKEHDFYIWVDRNNFNDLDLSPEIKGILSIYFNK